MNNSLKLVDTGKQCCVCYEYKDSSKFSLDKSKADGLSTGCRQCRSVYRHDPKRKERARLLMLSKHGITQDQYNAILIRQEHKCAICLSDDPSRGQSNAKHFTVDHNHKTGVIRGLLCPTCNRILGSLKDDPNIFDRAAKYLRDHGC